MKTKRKRRRSFWDYKPVKHPLGTDLGFDGCLLETYDGDLEIVRAQMAEDPTKVWTIIDGEGSSLSACAGFHFVNRFGYIITKESWETGNEYYARA